MTNESSVEADANMKLDNPTMNIPKSVNEIPVHCYMVNFLLRNIMEKKAVTTMTYMIVKYIYSSSQHLVDG